MWRLLWALIVGTVLKHADGVPSTEGRHFAVVLPSRRHENQPGTELTFTSHHHDTQVIITALNTTDSLYLTAGSTATREYGPEWHALIGQHPTAIYVTSEEPITVHYSVSTAAHNYYPDASLVQPWRENSTEFFLIGVPARAYDWCIAGGMGIEPLGGYYMIAAYEDNTNVTVFERSGNNWLIDEELELGLYDVYTYNGGDEDVTRIVESTKPIAVTSGNACSQIYASFEFSPYFHNVQETMPSTADFGTTFITNPIRGGHPDASYVVRVMAKHDDTMVTALGFYSTVIHQGDIIDFDGEEKQYWFSHTPLIVHCSEPCLAVQYTKHSTSQYPWSSPSMLVLTPVVSFSRELVFHPPSYITSYPELSSYLTVITSKYPAGDIYLNDTNLKELSDWVNVNDVSLYGAITLNIEWNIYHLYSTDPTTTFAAYLHAGHDSYASAISLNLGYGINNFEMVTTTDVVNTTTVSTTSTPTTLTTPKTTLRPPLAAPPPPESRLELTGSFHSGEDQEDFTQECMQSYQDTFTQKAATVLIDVNTKLGEELCEHLHHEDIEVHLSGTLLFANGTAGSSQVNYLVQSEGHVIIQDFLDCVDELKEHLESFSNWAPLPIIPPEPGCPPPMFDPQAFKANEDQQWLCFSENTTFETNEPVYQVHVSTDFAVADGTLDVSCTTSYSNNWQTEVQDMASEVTAQIDSGYICSAQSRLVAVKASTGNFLSLGDHGTISAIFSIEAISPDMMFDDLWLCAGDVFEAVEKHEDWPSSPIIPQPVGCPLLQYEELFMKHDGEHWFC